MSASGPRPPFDALPRNVSTSLILPYVTSDDWLNFRLASRSCYEIVHGTSEDGGTGNAVTADGGDDGGSLWRLALVRDYQFDESSDADLFHQSFRFPADSHSDAFLSTNDMFRGSNSFISWKHWRKVDILFHERRGLTGPTLSAIPLGERIVGPYFIRACAMWKKIEQWCDDEGTSGAFGNEIKRSFVPGRVIDPNIHGRIQNANTSALKAVYAFYAGQSDPMMTAPADRPQRFNPFTGLFGGFQAYHIISTTRWMEPESDDNDQQNFLFVAQGDTQKVVTLDLASGQLYYVFDANGNSRKQRATPTAIKTNSLGIRLPVDCKESILKWFEEHSNKLHQHFYAVGNMEARVPGAEGLSLGAIVRYPALADTVNCSRAVTRGVEVVASGMFVPEMDMFVYSIRIRLLTPDDGEGYLTKEQRGFNSCQLLSRHWRITDQSSPNSNESRVEEVQGEGVIGLYPRLYEGGYTTFESVGGRMCRTDEGDGYFSYQSCTGAVPGSIEGDLQFRPGSVEEPCGDLFNVRVAPFPLKFSQFLY